MTGPSESPDRWQRLWEVFHAALDRDPSERAAFLEAACGGDAEFRREVDELLAAHASGGILDQPVTPGAEPARPAFLPGDRLASRFRIVRLIGSGGMGTVYEARDEELGTSIAVKTLHPEMAQNTRALERFRREVLLARRVTHPNACRLFDLVHHHDAAGSVAFLTMELLRGETLAERLARTGPLTERDAYPIVEQIAGALAAAHRVGVVHRDLKSANVMLVPAGDGEPTARAVVTDFGLAVLTAAAAPAGAGLTRSGQLLGTPAFMAPEQIEGGAVTAATDIYALGLVMYEMVSGAVPFAGETPLTLAIKRLREQPPPPRLRRTSLRAEWNAAIMRCLEREPVDRFSTPEAVVAALQPGSTSLVFIPRRVRRRALAASVTAGVAMTLAGVVIWRAPQLPSNGAGAMLGAMEPAAGASSIAVLPFTFIGGEDADRQLPAKLAAGVTRKLEARGLTPRLAGADEGPAAQSRDPLAHGRSVGANFVLEGRLIRYGERIQGLAQLLDTAEGAPRWAHRFEYSRADLAAAEDALVNRIARTIDAAGSDAKLTDARSAAREAYEKGRYFWRNRSSIGLDRAISYFAQAIAADPTYGPAHAGLAAAYAFDIGHWPQAEASARKALELDATLSDAHAVLGFIRMFWQWRWDEARVEFTRAVALDRQNATARQWYAIWLASTDRQMEALAEMTEALRLDPFSSIIRADLAQIQSFGGQYTQAIELCRQTLEADPDFVSALLYLYDFYTQTGRYDEALDVFGRASEILETHPTYNRARVPLLRRAYETGGVRGFWRAILDVPEHLDWYVAAEHFARLGEIDQALGALGKAYDTRHFGLVYLRVNPAFDNMREHPGFKRLIRRIGIPPLGIPHSGRSP